LAFETDLVREPQVTIDEVGHDLRATLYGRWTADQAPAVERCVAEIAGLGAHDRRLIFDLSHVERLDTLGAWVLDRTRHDLGAAGHSADFVGASPEHHILLNEVAYRGFQPRQVVKRNRLVDFFVEIGQGVVAAGKDFAKGISFLGEVVSATIRVATRPRRFRGP
jgi:phospholipid/cholesterol/gamma-HCH transport system permease protein